MSEKTALAVSNQTKRNKILFMSLPVLILLLVYGAGFIVLPLSIFSSFQSKNCDPVLTLNKTYTSLYPDFVEDESLSDPVDECKAFKLASLNEENELWRDAYDAYQVYSGTYPNGLYAEEVHEHSAIVLLNIAKDESEQKNYDEAVADLSLILASYPDTSVSSDAIGFLTSVYTSWGAGLRESGDFEESERIFNDFKAWSSANQRTDLELNAKRELAGTYVAWGLDLGSQKQFEAALFRFDLAISATPDLVESVAEAKSGQRKTYIDWGNDLLAQGNYPLAIEKFELAVSRTDGINEDGASDSLVNGHIQWASNLGADEDFLVRWITWRSHRRLHLRMIVNNP
jgi:tetratricopeptide (TPR) repeat protein